MAILSQGPAFLVAELEDRLKKAGAVYTVQAIYYVLRKLRRDGVAVRMKGRYSLSLAWALELLELTRSLEQNFLKSAPAQQLVPELKQRRSWEFRDLYTLDDVWVQLMLHLVERSSDKTIWNYCPHPWFFYSQRPKMERFYRVLMKQGVRIKLLIGGDSALDRLFSRSMPTALYQCVHAVDAKLGLDSHFMSIGDFVLRVQLAADAARRIDEAFHGAVRASATDVLTVQAATSKPTRARLSVEHNARKARKHRSGMGDFF